MLTNKPEMRKKAGSIPVNKFGNENDTGISIERIAFEHLPALGEWEQPERHDRHSFFLLEKGSVTIEIDFLQYDIISPAIIYMHPDQVHRIVAFNSVSVCACAINDENLNPEYQQLLSGINPAAPLQVNEATFTLLAETASLCIKIAALPQNLFHHAIIKSQVNVLIGLMASLYIQQSPVEKSSRTELVTKAFRENLSLYFIQFKRPADYAHQLNISTAYLNECVKNTTGYPVSYHIQQRNILEAKRLLYHSNLSLKEIAANLGYEDYPYFSRLFTKVAGLSPAVFRKINRG